MIKEGMWAIQECNSWKYPMFEVTSEFSKLCVYDAFKLTNDINIVNIGNKSFLVAFSKDDLKTFILGKLFSKRDTLYADMKDIQNKIDIHNNFISKFIEQ
jgi:hypothetical protein